MAGGLGTDVPRSISTTATTVAAITATPVAPTIHFAMLEGYSEIAEMTSGVSSGTWHPSPAGGIPPEDGAEPSDEEMSGMEH